MYQHQWLGNNFGIGIDIESIDRFAELNVIQDSAFLNKVFTKNELEYCFSNKIAAPHLAVRYAGKESVIKALNSLGRLNLNYGDVEIINNKNGIPVVNINKSGFDDLGVQLSLSHCRDKAIAFAIVVDTRQHDEA